MQQRASAEGARSIAVNIITSRNPSFIFLIIIVSGEKAKQHCFLPILLNLPLPCSFAYLLTQLVVVSLSWNGDNLLLGRKKEQPKGSPNTVPGASHSPPCRDLAPRLHQGQVLMPVWTSLCPEEPWILLHPVAPATAGGAQEGDGRRVGAVLVSALAPEIHSDVHTTRNPHVGPASVSPQQEMHFE